MTLSAASETVKAQMPVADDKILERVAQGLKRAPAAASQGAAATQGAAPSQGAAEASAVAGGAPPPTTSSSQQGSILAQAAAVYVAKPDQPEATPGTGFDPVAAALFEALVEGAFLVANADGVVDDDERAAFEQVVASAATNGGMQASQVHALLSDLNEALAEDGIERRLEIVARSVTKADHRAEVLRVAALIAHVSGGVSEPERAFMERLAGVLDLGTADVDRAIADATAALSS